MSSAGFLTAGVDYQLPHPPIDDGVLLVTHNAICHALRILRKNGFPLKSAHEDAITLGLHEILEDRLRQSGEVPGFDGLVFGKVVRAPAVRNYDGTRPDKEPDLMFNLVRDNTLVRSSQDALFVECKIVGDSHRVASLYCNRGLSRFIDGDYAWAMQEGMMLGYVRHQFTLSANLSPVLARDPYRERLGTPSPLSVVPGGDANPLAEELHVTMHNRNFQWATGKGAATPIRIFHSWHDCS